MVALAACSVIEDPAPAPPCPNVLIVKDTAEFTAFRPGPGRDLTDVELDARIARFDGECETSLEKDRSGEVSVDLQLFFEATRGPANTTREGKFQYYVAIGDKRGRIRAKKIFETVLEFDSDRNRVGADEELTQVIPLRPGELGEDFDIFVGFQLSPEQLDYNRSKRAR